MEADSGGEVGDQSRGGQPAEPGEPEAGHEADGAGGLDHRQRLLQALGAPDPVEVGLEDRERDGAGDGVSGLEPGQCEGDSLRCDGHEHSLEAVARPVPPPAGR